jgi:hypothetical protein
MAWKDMCPSWVDHLIFGLHPPIVIKATQHPMEDRLHHGPILRRERGGGHMQSACPGRGGEGAGVGAPEVRPPTSSLHRHHGPTIDNLMIQNEYQRD